MIKQTSIILITEFYQNSTQLRILYTYWSPQMRIQKNEDIYKNKINHAHLEKNICKGYVLNFNILTTYSTKTLMINNLKNKTPLWFSIKF